VAKRPPSSGTSGRSSGGITGTTVRIIHSGLLPDSMKRLNQLQPLCQLLRLQLGGRFSDLHAQVIAQLLKLEPARMSRTASAPMPAVKLSSPYWSWAVMYCSSVSSCTVLERGQARLGYDVVLEIENPLEILQRHVEQQADARRQRLQEPDMRHRRGQLDMAHALAAHLGQRDFHAALFADDALVLHALVLAAQAFVVLDRTKDAGAEQAVALRLERTVVDCLRLLDLAE
jgi:hypothetical protein